MAAVNVRVQKDDFDIKAEIERVRADHPGIGAVVTFSGLCRDEGGTLAALELEHYQGMAEAELARIAEQSLARWTLDAVTIVHRHGRLTPGDNIVLVVTAASHRGPAIEAAAYIMDYLKTRAPFWKKEHLVSGEAGSWVAAKTDDDDAAERWEDQPTTSTSENQ